jgi:hypothetical protein
MLYGLEMARIGMGLVVPVLPGLENLSLIAGEDEGNPLTLPDTRRAL